MERTCGDLRAALNDCLGKGSQELRRHHYSGYGKAAKVSPRRRHNPMEMDRQRRDRSRSLRRGASFDAPGAGGSSAALGGSSRRSHYQPTHDAHCEVSLSDPRLCQECNTGHNYQKCF